MSLNASEKYKGIYTWCQKSPTMPFAWKIEVRETVKLSNRLLTQYVDLPPRSHLWAESLWH